MKGQVRSVGGRQPGLTLARARRQVEEGRQREIRLESAREQQVTALEQARAQWDGQRRAFEEQSRTLSLKALPAPRSAPPSRARASRPAPDRCCVALRADTLPPPSFPSVPSGHAASLTPY